MAGDRNDCDHGSSFLPFDFIGAVVPKNAVSSRCVVLRVRLEDLLAICPSQRCELVRINARGVGGPVPGKRGPSEPARRLPLSTARFRVLSTAHLRLG